MTGPPNSLLLFALLGTAGATSAVTSQDPGYDLRSRGSEVSLALHRGLSVPEFLDLAQQVTRVVHVFRPEDVAGLEPVTLTGRIRCERAQFGDFVQTMLYVRGLCLVPSAAGDGALEVESVLPQGKQPLGYDLRSRGSEVSLVLHRGLSIPEFLDLAQQVTRVVHVFRPEDVAGLEPVTLTGRIRCERAEFGDFVQTMLYLRGLCLVPSAAGDGTFVVQSLQQHRARPARRKSV